MSGIIKDGRLADQLARRIWDERAAMEIVHGERSQDHADIEYPVTLVLPGDMRIDLESGGGDAVVDMAGHRRKLDRYSTWPLWRAWRAVQAAGILEAIGDDLTPEMVAHATGGPIARALRRLRGTAPTAGAGMVERLDEVAAQRVAQGRTTRIDGSRTVCGWHGDAREAPIIWHGLGDDASFTLTSRWSMHGDDKVMIAKHPRWGNVQAPCRRTGPAVDLDRSTAYREALGGPVTRTVAAPQTTNARIAHIVRACREAVQIDPDMTDARGTPVRPLVETHLPDLLRRHAAAIAATPAKRAARLDADLEAGVEIVRRATEEALGLVSDRRADALATQLRFLESRHPEDA